MNWFNQLKIKSKLALLIGCFALGFVVFTLVAFDTLNTLKIKGHKYNQIVASKDAIADVLPPPKYIIESYLLALELSDPANKSEVPALIQNGRDLRSQYDDRQAFWKTDTLLPAAVRENLTVASHTPALQFFEVRDRQLIPAVQRGDYTRARAIVNGPLRASYQTHRDAIDKVVSGSTAFNAQVEGESEQLIARRTAMLIALSLAILLFFGIGLGNVISRSITRSLAQTAGELSATSAQMAATVEQHERTALLQSSAVHQTTTTMDELDASFGQTAEMVKVASDTAQNAADDADNGGEIVSQTLDGMNSLREKVSVVSDQISNLSEQLNQVGIITRVVGDLANQTNMLALNAAVEAARAGEHGKGFGVVAAEVRKLADESRKSVERIQGLVDEIKKATDATVMATEEEAKTVEADMVLAEKTAVAFRGIAQSSNAALEAASQTLLAVPQQVAAVRQVLAAMEDLNRGARETTEGLGQTKESMAHLQNAAHRLKAMI